MNEDTKDVERLPENISYVAYESAMARAESRYDKLLGHLKLVIDLWFVTVLLFVCASLWYLTLPVEETYDNVSQTTDKGGSNSIVGGDYHGETDDNTQNNP